MISCPHHGGKLGNICPLCRAAQISERQAYEATEWGKFNRNPLAWLQEWNDKNGEVVFSRSPVTGAYSVRLHVEDMPMPISTGVARTVEAAMKNAIDGLDAVSGMG